MSKFFNISWETPLKLWWKARKFFKKPKSNFYFGKLTDCLVLPMRNSEGLRIFDFYSQDLTWRVDPKTKKPVYEYPPQIGLVLFGKYKLLWWWSKPSQGKDMSADYWESILRFLYFGDRKSPVNSCPGCENLCLKPRAYYNYLEYYYKIYDTETPSEEPIEYKVILFTLATKRTESLDQEALGKIHSEFPEPRYVCKFIGIEKIGML